MNLDEAGSLLAEVSGQSLRNYSTYEFGRDRDANARSVIISSEQAVENLIDVRNQLGAGLVCFIGSTVWHGDEKPDGDELVVAKAESQFDILRVARSDAVNHDMETEDLVKKLTEYDDRYGIDIFHAETDTIEFVFVEMPSDLDSFVEDLYEFCPDIVDQGTETLERLAQEISERRQVSLWWD